MGRLKGLVNLIVLAIGAFIVWRELTKPRDEQAGAPSSREPSGSRPTPVPTPLSSREPASPSAGDTAYVSAPDEPADTGITGIVSDVAGMAGDLVADDAPAPEESAPATGSAEPGDADGAAVGETIAAPAAGDEDERESNPAASASAPAGGAFSASSTEAAGQAGERETAAGGATGSERAEGPAAGSGGGSNGADSGQQASQAGPPVPPNAVRGDGTNVCPADHPIKGNATSMIYHEPGRSSYDRTIPEFCFASVEAAESAGFRAPKH